MVRPLQNDRPDPGRSRQGIRRQDPDRENGCRCEPGRAGQVRHPRHPDADPVQERRGCGAESGRDVQSSTHVFHRQQYLKQNGQTRRGGALASSLERHYLAVPSPSNLSHPGTLTMHLSELKALHVSALLDMAISLDIDNAARLRKQELMFAIMKKRAKGGEQVFGDGVLEVLPDGFGFLRAIDESYMASTDDIYLSPSQIRRFNLHTGDMIEGEVRVPKDGERYFALVKVDRVNGVTPEESKHKIMFENLTPLFPKEAFRLERDIRGEENITSRII